MGQLYLFPESGESNNHHVLWPRKLWRAQPPTRMIRENYWLKPPLDQATHNALHRTVPMVPTPGHMLAERILKLYEPQGGSFIGSLENLIRAVEQATIHPSTPAIEQALGSLVINALDAQRPFIAEGLIVPTDAA